MYYVYKQTIQCQGDPIDYGIYLKGYVLVIIFWLVTTENIKYYTLRVPFLKQSNIVVLFKYK